VRKEQIRYSYQGLGGADKRHMNTAILVRISRMLDL